MKKQALLFFFTVFVLCLLASCNGGTEEHVHTPVKTERVEATCVQDGHEAYWTCLGCQKLFSDEACLQEITLAATILTNGSHKLEQKARTEGQGHKTGQIEHWACAHCGKLFAGADAAKELTAEEILLPAPLEIDFLVEVETGREPVVLQITDPQFMDASQIRTPTSLADWQKEKYKPEKINALAFDYLTELFHDVKPDLILVTGDLVFGQFDDNGSMFLDYVAFMESFGIPWAPIFGNHENEALIGADWQSQQLENAKNCLFKQRTLTGNGNYTVGIEQGGELKRVFFMLDSNGCADASRASLFNQHTSRFAGFGVDQIEWYTALATEIRTLSPNTKLSFAFHIPLAAFSDALAKYGYNEAAFSPVYIDRHKNKTETDFGHVGQKLLSQWQWDADRTVWEGIKALGVDSIFVGHYHNISASVVWEGVRLQFGQKSSEYDKYNYIAPDGTISASSSAGAVPLVGGTVMTLTADGSIGSCYIHYCKNAGGNVNWSQWENTK